MSWEKLCLPSRAHVHSSQFHKLRMKGQPYTNMDACGRDAGTGWLLYQLLQTGNGCIRGSFTGTKTRSHSAIPVRSLYIPLCWVLSSSFISGLPTAHLWAWVLLPVPTEPLLWGESVAPPWA